MAGPARRRARARSCTAAASRAPGSPAAGSARSAGRPRPARSSRRSARRAAPPRCARRTGCGGCAGAGVTSDRCGRARRVLVGRPVAVWAAARRASAPSGRAEPIAARGPWSASGCSPVASAGPLDRRRRFPSGAADAAGGSAPAGGLRRRRRARRHRAPHGRSSTGWRRRRRRRGEAAVREAASVEFLALYSRNSTLVVSASPDRPPGRRCRSPPWRRPSASGLSRRNRGRRPRPSHRLRSPCGRASGGPRRLRCHPLPGFRPCCGWRSRQPDARNRPRSRCARRSSVAWVQRPDSRWGSRQRCGRRSPLSRFG